MKKATALRLISLNRQFYQTFGREFSATRQHLQPGILKVLGGIDKNESILDLGCGNGELARELMRRGHTGRYTGLDYSRTLLEAARHGWEDAPATFLGADLTSADWDKQVTATSERTYNVVTAFALLHHIPGRDRRVDLMNKVQALLVPGGRFIHSEWQFLNSDKLKTRLQSWSGIGLDESDVDPGDYLLDWRSGGRGLRYVHHFDLLELEDLAAASGFRVGETFLSDGENNRLGLYQSWEKT